MGESKKWKSKLLSSSVPMEYEVAKFLVSKKFAVDSEFSYSRVSDDGVKDFSVDLSATKYFNFDEGKEIPATLTMLVECKHRQRSSKWLFFQDPNDPEMSQFVLGYSLRCVDDFSYEILNRDICSQFDNDVFYCMKGIEVDMSEKGNVHEAEIKHGLSQLQYSIPDFIFSHISHSLNGHKDDNTPFFYMPVLLTNSELYVAKPDVSSSVIEESDDIEDFAEKVDYLVVGLGIAPELEKHSSKVFSQFIDELPEENLKDVENFRLFAGEYPGRSPIKILENLAFNIDRSRSFEYYSQVVVCSMKGFESLIDKVGSIANESLSNLNSHE
ncbi:hypothetical protein L0636_07560 [Halomonas janggokensis]|uniref:hypothetical protein n=1 Tax=Vreelandella janggokensis TaxID=370767 RepID=UPI0022A6B010|nr:hypothetical protein [Halomonas janggokensis]MCZ0930279.1 hypothetical protein [Halomonas janggokensis]